MQKAKSIALPKVNVVKYRVSYKYKNDPDIRSNVEDTYRSAIHDVNYRLKHPEYRDIELDEITVEQVDILSMDC